MPYDKNVGMSLLLDFYGEMLTAKQRETAELYYNEDLSLSEIAALTGLTRPGVRDRLVKAQTILAEYEDKLGLLERFTAVKAEIASITQRLSELACGLGVDLSGIISELERIQ